MALVCDLQSMLHKTLSHFTVINKTPCTVPQVCVLYLLAQVARFLTMCPKSDRRYFVLPYLSNDPLSGKGKRVELQETPCSQAPPLSYLMCREKLGSTEETCSER